LRGGTLQGFLSGIREKEKQERRELTQGRSWSMPEERGGRIGGRKKKVAANVRGRGGARKGISNLGVE